MPRLFVAIELPDEHKQALETLCSGVPGARWMRDQQFHVTLRFLGELDGPTAQRVGESLHGVRTDPFELTLEGVGRFPPRGMPRVLWVGVEPNEQLLVLHRSVEKVLKRAGLPPDARRYAPHVTIARMRDVSLSRLAGFLGEHERLRLPPFPVTDIHLVRSVLGSEGAQHVVEQSYPLFAARPG